MRQSFLLPMLVVFAVIWAAVIAVSWIGWGPWAAYSHIHGIATVAIGAVIFLLIRRGARRHEPVDEIDAPFVGYPVGQVLAILDSREQADGAVNELRSGFPDDAVTTYAGREGAAALDSEGTAHGVGEMIQRSVEHMVADESDLQRYEDAVLEGGVVVSVRADGDAALAASVILSNHEAHDVFHFGRFAVERLDVDRSRTRS